MIRKRVFHPILIVLSPGGRTDVSPFSDVSLRCVCLAPLLPPPACTPGGEWLGGRMPLSWSKQDRGPLRFFALPPYGAVEVGLERPLTPRPKGRAFRNRPGRALPAGFPPRGVLSRPKATRTDIRRKPHSALGFAPLGKGAFSPLTASTRLAAPDCFLRSVAGSGRSAELLPPAASLRRGRF